MYVLSSFFIYLLFLTLLRSLSLFSDFVIYFYRSLCMFFFLSLVSYCFFR